jgi:hypothetical protein
MLTDRYELALSTASSAARDAYVEGCEAKLTMYPGAIDGFDRAIAADPGFALAHAARAHVLLERGEAAAARTAIAAASVAGWRDVLELVVGRYRGTVKRRYFRGDAAFANPEMYEFPEAEGIGYTIRLPANNVLQGRIGYLLKRPVGRPGA